MDLPQNYDVDYPAVRVLTALRLPLFRWRHENLRAPYWRLYHNSAPGAWITLENARIHLTPEHCFLIPAETSFASENEGAASQLFVHFLLDPPWVMPETDCTVAAVPMDGTIAPWVQKLENGSLDSHEQAAAVSAWIHAALAHVRLRPASKPLPAPVQRACGYMETHFSSAITNEDLARRAGMSTNAFIRLFRQSTGTPPQQWLAAERIRQACFRLHHTEETIESIAEACGFYDRFHFSRVFRKHRGMGPAAFRQLQHR